MGFNLVPLFLVFMFLSSLFLNGSVIGATVSEECSEQFQKVGTCLTYATGKASNPSKDCCSSINDLKESDPKCLCYIMEQTHNGSAEFKNLGIQEDKLLQLPSACQLQNASISYCPKLLGLSPNSPDAAIFTNASTTTPTTPATSTGGTSAPVTTANSSASQFGASFASLFMISLAIFAYIAFPSGSGYMSYLL